ncbi:MAG: elongation factor G, partial [Desulfarculaceae bacterium]
MSNDINLTRTFALVGHGGSGKTSLAEAMLFNAKAVDRLGKVDDNSATLDFEPEEAKRGGSVSAAFGHYSHKKHNIHFIDAPGDDNFLCDAAAAMRAVDGVLLVGDAIDGIKVQGEKAWSFVQENELPAILIINKMDRDRADFDQALGVAADLLGVKPVRLQLPIGVGEGFSGVVDLLAGKAYTFTKDGSGKMSTGDIPDDMADAVESARETLIEDIAEADDSLMERYLEGEELSAGDLAQGLAKGVRDRLFIPVAVCSALNNMGVQPIMDLTNQLLPSPVEAGPIEGKNSKSGDEEQRDPSTDAPLAALVFKTVSDPFAGRLSMVRVFSGKLSSDLQLFNPNQDTKERFNQMLLMTGKNQKPVSEAMPGDLVAIPKLKDTVTGDTLTDDKSPIQLPELPVLPALMSYAIEAKEKGDEEKVFAGINKLLEEDPSLRLERDPQTGEALLSGLGSVHIETTLEKLKRKFSVEVNLKTPKVPYRETIKGKTRVQGRYKKQTGGRGQFGDTWLEIEPAGANEGFVFVNKIVGGAIPRNYIPAVEKGITEAMV